MEELTVEKLLEENQELIAKIHFLLAWIASEGLLTEYCFTFPDGEIWYTQ